MSLKPHPESSNLQRRITVISSECAVGFDGIVYRMVDPQWSNPMDIVNGKGGLSANGRWHIKKSARVSYTCLEPETAMAESFSSPRYYRFPIRKVLPKVLVAIRVKLFRVIDFGNGLVRQRLKVSDQTMMETDWRKKNFRGEEAITQCLGRCFCENKVEGLLVPSTVSSSEQNLIVFPENLFSRSIFSLDYPVKWSN